ncbi:MAG: phosphate ABC transporter, permease protein PstA, partial [Gammaproteobacteria bacterium]
MSNVEFIYLKRRIANAATMVLSGLATIFGLFFLIWILWTTLSKGIDAIGPHLFTQMTPPPGEVSGG